MRALNMHIRAVLLTESDMNEIHFSLNGAMRQVSSLGPVVTLLDHLRLAERLTATKEGCAEGDCGACTVAIGQLDEDGQIAFRAVNSCLMLTHELDGKLVVTTEALAKAPSLHQVQELMVERHASQCGFCTPGFVMSLFAYEQSPATRPALHEMLAGNLCRCTGYRPIIDAAHDIAARPQSLLPAHWAASVAALPDACINAAAPADLDELDRALHNTPSAKLLAGGTDLGVAIAKYGADPGPLISLRNLAALREVKLSEDALMIGAAASYSTLLPFLERLFPAFAAMVRRIGSLQIRNVASMGGNLCNASPIGDSAPCLIALDAILTLRSIHGVREVQAGDFFAGYRKTILREGEYLWRIRIPLLAPAQSFHTYKLAKRYEQDISTVSAAFRLTRDNDRLIDVRAAFGGMAATPVRARAIEAALVGGRHEPAALLSAIDEDFTPLSDFRGSADYRRQASCGILQKLLAQQEQSLSVEDVWQL
ncbi:MAG TPA: xanthine dehydrogenase small subunit [Acetobacteraceae bacterium]|nr:xanthine dehydrogenase small subunit [Acetobacteraceae bacterium]